MGTGPGDPVLGDEQWSDIARRTVAGIDPGNGMAPRRPTTAERPKAERQARERPARVRLREVVSLAGAAAAGESEFFNRLQAAGTVIEPHVASSGDLLGYKAALPGGLNSLVTSIATNFFVAQLGILGRFLVRHFEQQTRIPFAAWC
ncbi:hypothetical protein [Streptomyces sp. NPDC059224]|uniref:hypothetical protein n=1 Tax=Streptomyces sp. NPDC059224 TaxID=3346775 RepID=UPI0036971F97